MLLPPAALAADELPEEARAEKATHDLLFEGVVKTYDAKMRKQVNNSEMRLMEVDFLAKPVDVDGSTDIALPDDVWQVMDLFDHIDARGTGLTGVETIYGVRGGQQVTMSMLGQSDKQIRMRPKHFNKRASVPDDNALRFEGEGRVTALVLYSKTGISPEFDMTPYITLGLDRPVKDVTVTFSVEAFRAIEGISELDRARYFRLYFKPNSQPAEQEAYYRSRNFLPGRQMFKFGPALEKGYPNQPGAGLKEDPKRPGYADPEIWDRMKDETYKDTAKTYPGLQFAMCFNNWPSFMEVKKKGIHNEKGTPKDYDAAADLVVGFLKNQVADSGMTATHWEVKNESTVKPEWCWHNVKGVDSWKLLADFHNTVADAVHNSIPDVKIGGPTSAWMQVEVNDFGLWREQARFMDNTRNSLDFYSHHFYESTSPCSYDALRDGYRNYLQGKLEAELDMIAAHMHETDNVKPLVISEYGTLNAGNRESDYWARLKNFSSYTVQLLDRPHQFDFVVPFSLGYMHWNKEAGSALFKLDDPDQKTGALRFHKTKNTYYVELWKDFAGRRVPVESNDARVRAHAVLNGNTVQIVLNNLNGQRLRVNLAAMLGGASVETATIRRVYKQGAKVVYEEATAISSTLAAIPMEVEETAIVAIQLSRTPKPSYALNEKTYYAEGTALVNSGAPIQMTVNVPEEDLALPLKRLQLRVGLQREGGFGEPLLAGVNREKDIVDLSDTTGISYYFSHVTTDINPSQLRESNDIFLQLGETGGRVLSVALIATREEPL